MVNPRLQRRRDSEIPHGAGDNQRIRQQKVVNELVRQIDNFLQWFRLHWILRSNRLQSRADLSAEACPSPFSTEREMQLLQSERQPPSAWRHRPNGWRLQPRPYGYWLAWHTTVRGRG